MLTSILPGLRELRNPLVIGWAWFIGLAILIHNDIPRLHESSDLLNDAYSLSNLIGKATVFGLLTFVAYLFGSLALRGIPARRRYDSAAWNDLILWLSDRQSTAAIPVDIAAKFAFELTVDQILDVLQKRRDKIPQSVYDILQERRLLLDEKPHVVGALAVGRVKISLLGHYVVVERGSKIQTHSRDDDHSAAALVAKIIYKEASRELTKKILSNERKSLSTKLLTIQKDVYEQFDRAEESSSLRLNLVFPVIFIGGSLAFVLWQEEDNALFGIVALIVGVILAAALFVRGTQQARAADTVLVEAIKASLTTSPTLDRLAQARDEVNARSSAKSREGLDVHPSAETGKRADERPPIWRRRWRRFWRARVD